MMLKKEMKLTTNKGSRNLDDSHQEMNELIESDEEVNAADIEDVLFNQSLNNSDEEGDIDDDLHNFNYDFDDDERSLVDSDEERDQLRKRKDKEAKINNSFTGPYPLDPTDFNHTDKGPNNQFEHLVLLRQHHQKNQRLQAAKGQAPLVQESRR